MFKGSALIRAVFNVEPENLTDEKWTMLYAQALWIKQWRLKNQAELLGKLFGGKKK